MGNGSRPAPVNVNATTAGSISVQSAPGPDGRIGVLVVLNIPGAQVAYWIEPEQASAFQQIVTQVCAAARSGLHVVTDLPPETPR